jgi:hypothetical protein
MIAYKGFTKDLRSRLGDGKEENCCFVVGETKEVAESKTARNGFHCCENPFDCTTYYDLDGENRFFMVEAAGDIDEDDFGRIACTKITLIKELTYTELALEGMKYIITHPDRDGWMSGKHRVMVQQDKAEATGEGYIAIARGSNPMVRGEKGSILGLIVENQEGTIINAKLFVADRQQARKWYTIDADRNLQEVANEKERN